MTITILWVIVLMCCVPSLAYALFSIWFDSRYPTEAQERAQADVEELLKRANEETANRPRVRAGTKTYQPGE